VQVSERARRADEGQFVCAIPCAYGLAAFEKEEARTRTCQLDESKQGPGCEVNGTNSD
jgi:hypothetical protein